MRSLALALVIGACGYPRPADVGGDDAAVDAPVQLEFHHYITSQQVYPQNNTEARAMGLDLNGDQTVDNQLGMVAGTLAGQGFDLKAEVTAAVDQGEVLELVELGVEAFDGGFATITLFEGANPQPPACASGGDLLCRHHLDGNAMFAVAPSAPHDPPLPGAIAGTVMTTRLAAGSVHLVTTLFTNGPITLELLGARVQLSSPSVEQISGIIAGAITETDVDNKLMPGWQANFQAIVTRDCPGGAPPPDCGCAGGSQGKTVLGLFDTAPQDCFVTLGEIQNNSLIQSLLAPDVTIEGQQALSLGIGFTAVPGAFTP